MLHVQVLFRVKKIIIQLSGFELNLPKLQSRRTQKKGTYTRFCYSLPLLVRPKDTGTNYSQAKQK